MPSTLNIGYWLQEDPQVSECQMWIKAYACVLQCVAEVAKGQRWIAEGQHMAPEVSKLVEAFLTVTGTEVLLHRIQECWPSPKKGYHSKTQ